MYDVRAPVYPAGGVAADAGWHGRLRNLLLAAAPVPRRADVLDLCTGTGVVGLAAARALGGGGGVVVGVDFSEEMLARARAAVEEEGLGNVRFVVGDVEEEETVGAALAEVGGRGFDVVYCSAAVPWFDSLEGTLRAWRRAVKPGGTLAFNGWSEDSFLVGATMRDVAWERGWTVAVPSWHVPTATPAACRALLRAAGWHVVDVVETDMSGVKSAAAVKDGFETMLSGTPSKNPEKPLLRDAFDEAQIAELKDAYCKRIDEFADEDGNVVDQVITYTIVGRRPQ